ncbi:MAG: hypothetical protein RL410_343 [Actinomycetota bacterium]
MLIRSANSDDAQAFTDFLIELDWFSAIKNSTPEQVLATSARALDSDSDRVLVVAVEDEKILGYAHLVFMDVMFLSGPSAYLSELFVLPVARGRGIGTELLEHVIAGAKARKASRIMLNNDRERDAYERGFYAKHGFVERETMANFALKLTYVNE